MADKYYIDLNGELYGNDRQTRPDGTLDPIAPTSPGPNYRWNGADWALPTPTPDWEGLTQQFQFPGNALYAAIAAQVAVSGFAAQDHWSNFKLMMLSPSLRSTDTLAAGMGYLVFLLGQAGQAIDADVKAEWNTLITTNHFPDDCKL